MPDAPKPAPHTPLDWHETREGRGFIEDCRGREVAQVRSSYFTNAEHEANRRLVVAACNSYDKHCGPRAVECAEADLLGKALDALKDVREWLMFGTYVKDDGIWHPNFVKANNAVNAVLALADRRR